jgi:hypothetical protein
LELCRRQNLKNFVKFSTRMEGAAPAMAAAFPQIEI